MATPYVTIIVAEAVSTQDLAAAALDEYSRPVLAIAHRQTGGRGRSGREWWQARRGIAASLAFRSSDLPVAITFPLEAAMAVRGVLVDAGAMHVGLKWPNDLLLGGRKVGGILVERSGDRVTAGCGLNLWWPESPEGMGSVFPSDPGGTAGVALSLAWADELFRDPGNWDRNGYVGVCETIGTEITWEPNGRGVARGIDNTGGLVVETAAGEVTLRSGEVRSVRRVG